jgi:chaperonin GroES
MIIFVLFIYFILLLYLPIIIIIFIITKAGNIKRLLPLFDRVLVERFAKETTTKGGIMIPDKSSGKVLNATVIAVGPGTRSTKTGSFVPCSVKPGDKVLLPEYGGNKIELDSKEYYLFRDSDILGKWQD